VTRVEEQREIEEALDRLLEPLAEDARPENGHRLPPLEIVPLDRSGPGVRDLAVRLRWSERGVFRILRLVAGWTVGLAVFWAAIWLILSVGDVR
jgi:hypothetical protein